jgi:hypothetical protein
MGFMKLAERRFFLATGIVTFLWLAVLISIHAGNSRLLPAWHGFLHGGIAARVAESNVPPENPYFAGNAIPYYWLYHFCASCFSRIFSVDLLHTFRWITLISLVVLIFFSARIGYTRGSIFAGILTGYFALVGVNPLGPLIAIAKHMLRGIVLIDGMDSGNAFQNVFVDNAAADRLMTQPLLPALHIASDWRHGQNIVWFLDVSSRGPALAMIMVLIFLLWSAKPSKLKALMILVSGALITALNPLIGFATTGSLAIAAGLLYAADSRKHPSVFLVALVPFAGALLAFPFYIQILKLTHGTIHLTSSLQFFFLKTGAMVANFLILAPLAAASIRTNSQDPILRTIALAGILLVLAVPFVALAPSNEHNLSNAAQCILAVPAANWIMAQRKHKKAAYLSLVLFLPTTACTLFSFAHRPALPLRFEGRILHRVPSNHPLEHLYTWIRASTASNAVFLSDPERPVKMSGNVSELPAFTGRALFVDTESYLTLPYRDYGLRKKIAEEAVDGQSLTESEIQYLHLLRRPSYIVTYRGEDLALMQRLETRYGNAIFRDGFVRVYRFP